MHIGILKADSVLEQLQPRHGDYPHMFRTVLSRARGEGVVRFTTHDVVAAPPPTPDHCDGWLITGSRASSYDDLAWIGALEDFIRDAHAMRAPLVGVCFGHQLVAQALGGRVARAEAGWVVGQHRVEIGTAREWMSPAHASPLLPASHQDQVRTLPEGARVEASHPACPIAAYTIGDHILCIQGHPEFTAAYARDLLEVRRPVLGDALADQALASYSAEGDQQIVARWMLEFLERADHARRSRASGAAAQGEDGGYRT